VIDRGIDLGQRRFRGLGPTRGRKLRGRL